MSALTITCPAKINLGLQITGKTENGYHEVTTVMAKLPLADTLQVEFLGNQQPDEIICDHEQVPCDRDNLLAKTLTLLRTHYPVPACRFTLTKNIPVGSGLAGGSSNAGRLLMLLDRHFGWHFTTQQVQTFALTLGADVPFFTRPEKVSFERHHGIENLVTVSLPDLPKCQLVLVYQDFPLDTAAMYAAFDRQPQSNHASNKMNKLITAIRERQLTEIATHLHNDFQEVVETAHPHLRQIREKLTQAGALGCGLTGKGPTIFGLLAPGQKLLTKELANLNYQVFQLESVYDPT